MVSLALCQACGSSTFQVLLGDFRETVRCAECHAGRFTIPEWDAVPRDLPDEERFEAIREAMERKAKATFLAGSRER